MLQGWLLKKLENIGYIHKFQMNRLHGQNLLISPANSLRLSTSTTEKSTLACSDALTPFPLLFPFSASALLFLPVHSTCLLKCNVRWSHREWDRQPKRAKETVSSIFFPTCFRSTAAIYISQRAFMSNSIDNIKWTQHIYTPPVSPGMKSERSW